MDVALRRISKNRNSTNYYYNHLDTIEQEKVEKKFG